MNKRLFVLITISVLLTTLYSTSIADAEDEIDYRFERMWPRLEQPWYFSTPMGLTIASDDSVYIADKYNDRVKQFSLQGDFIRSWGDNSGKGKLNHPIDVAIASDKSIYISDEKSIKQFSSQGDFIRSWEVKNLSGIAFSPNGFIYAVNRHVHSPRIMQFTLQGDFIREWGSAGSGNGQFYYFNLVHAGITVASNGDVYVTDPINHRIQQFTAEGNFIRSWKNEKTHYPRDVKVTLDGNVYILNRDTPYIQKFNQNGDLVQSLEMSLGTDNKSIGVPEGIGIAQNGSIYISNFSNQIKKFSSQGDFIQAWKSHGNDDSQFQSPSDITTSSDGNIYVTDQYNHRIQQFNKEGDFIRQWGVRGQNKGQFDFPTSLTVSPNNNLYIADKLNHRVQQFTPQGDFIRMWGESGSGNGEFQYLVGISIAPDGSIYTLEGELSDNPRVQQFTPQGDFIRTWGKKGSKNGAFMSPAGITVGSDGHVYIIDPGNGSVQKFTAQGDFIQTVVNNTFLGQFIGQAITIDSEDNIYIPYESNEINFSGIFKYDKKGNIINRLGNEGSGNGQYSSPQGLHFSTDKNLYIADTGNNRIQKFSPKSKTNIIIPSSTETKPSIISHPYKAIILAGGGKTIAGRPNHIWNGTKRVTEKAYRALTNQAFKQYEEIKFLTAGNTQVDLDNNKKFDDYEVATKESLRQAITEWAIDAKDVVIFLANHGGPGKFQINDHEILTAEELNIWLSQLKKIIPGKITVVIEACNSAGFFSQLSGIDRYLLASAKANQPAVISNDGLTSFSYYFWSEIATGAHLGSAFKDARQGMSKIRIANKSQDSQAETDGNHTFNQQDIHNIKDYCLGNCNQTAAAAPNIDPMIPNRRILHGEKTQKFNIAVNHLQPLDRAWALIQRPDDVSIDPNQPLNFEKIDLICKNSLCQGEYNNLDLQGEYLISFYAMDSNGETSFPETLTLTQTQGKTVNAVHYNEDKNTFYIRDVTLDDLHFQAVLKKQGTQYVAFEVKQNAEIFPYKATFSAINKSLILPKVNMSGKDYHLTFDYLGGLNFQLKITTTIIEYNGKNT